MVADGDAYGFSLEFDTEIGLVRAVQWGKVHLKDWVGFADAILTDPRWKPGMSLLSDIRKADLSEFTFDDMQQYVTHVLTYERETVGTRVATVVATSLNFGVIRMWDAQAEIQQTPVQNRVFQSMDEAEAWLGVARERAGE